MVRTFCHFLGNSRVNMVKKLIDTAIKTGIDAAETASKSAFQKTAEAAGDLIRNKIADNITSVGQSKNDHQK